MRKFFIPSLVALLALIPIDSFAHHGKEYLLISTYKTPPRGSLFAVLSSDYVRTEQQTRGFEFEPGLLYGLTNSWSIELHSHNDVAAGDFHTESIGLETRFRFFGSGEVHEEEEAAYEHETASPIALAALLEYEKGLKDSHDAFEGRLIVGKDFRQLSLAANFILQKEFERGEKLKFLYGLGIKHSFDEWLGVGIELESGSAHENGARLTPGFYTTLSNRLDIRIGASFRLRDAENKDLSLRSAVVYAF